MGIALYGMFLAIILPPATKSRAVAICVAIAAALSIILSVVPLFSAIPSGFAIVICAVVSGAVVSWLFPVADEEGSEA